jgi:enoyl-CoA hydratase
MSETLVQDGEVVVRALGALRRLTLNRPQALNALTHDMALTLTAFLRSWSDDPEVGAVLIDGAGERAFCAGGDLRALYDAAKSGNPLPAQFWATEYKLNVLIARYPKPVIAVMDGLVMGGGVGISAHASHRVVTERSVVAMPEVGIGFFPDVGASFLLARAPGQVGTHLALTGDRIGPADAIFCGFADAHIPAARRPEIPSTLSNCRSRRDVEQAIAKLQAQVTPGVLSKAREWIDANYSPDRVEDIVDGLRHCDTDAARRALELIEKASPTSLKVTLKNLRDAAGFTRVEQCFQQDYRIALACIAGHDFIEGIRATIVDKDRKPAWRPDNLADVTPDIVARHFRSVGELELTFPG